MAQFLSDSALDASTLDTHFPISDLAGLRDELLQSGLDTWQVAELIARFFASHGFGISHDKARSAAARVSALCGSLDGMKTEFERLALPM
jgi:hypothetical protein